MVFSNFSLNFHHKFSFVIKAKFLRVKNYQPKKFRPQHHHRARWRMNETVKNFTPTHATGYGE